MPQYSYLSHLFYLEISPESEFQEAQTQQGGVQGEREGEKCPQCNTWGEGANKKFK